MAKHRDSSHTSGIRAGNIRGTGIVLGHASSAYVAAEQPISGLKRDVIEQLDKFLRLLDDGTGSARDPAQARELATAAREEVSQPSPKWHVVRNLLNGITGVLTAGSALTEIVRNIETLIGHTPH